eukprot:3056107-Amphidinium_carterae.1
MGPGPPTVVRNPGEHWLSGHTGSRTKTVAPVHTNRTTNLHQPPNNQPRNENLDSDPVTEEITRFSAFVLVAMRSYYVQAFMG